MTGVKHVLLLCIFLSFIFVVVGVTWLSNSMETLDQVAEHFGATASPLWNPPIPEYEIPGFQGNQVMNIGVGILFTLIVFASTSAVAKCLRLLKHRV